MVRGQFDIACVDVDADDPDTGRFEQQAGQLPEQAETDHHAALAEAQIRLPNTLHGNRTQCVVGSCAEFGAGRQRDTEIDRNRYHLRVIRVAGTSARHTVTDREFPHISGHRNDLTGAAVAKRRVCFQLLLHGTVRLHRTLLRQHFEQLTHLLWPLLCLAKQAFACGGDRAAFGACADKRIVIAHENHPVLQKRRRHVDHAHLAVAQPLCQLLQVSVPGPLLEEKSAPLLQGDQRVNDR
jgi:hypothetical protein